MEAAVVAEARGIMASAELTVLRGAHGAGRQVEVIINGRLVVYVPEMKASGMALFGENGFVVGPEAFISKEELGRTMLHELYRLHHTKSAMGVHRALVADETAAAAGFAERAAALLGL